MSKIYFKVMPTLTSINAFLKRLIRFKTQFKLFMAENHGITSSSFSRYCVKLIGIL